MATGNMQKNLVKFGRVVFELCKRDEVKTRSKQHCRQNGGGGSDNNKAVQSTWLN